MLGDTQFPMEPNDRAQAMHDRLGGWVAARQTATSMLVNARSETRRAYWASVCSRIDWLASGDKRPSTYTDG
jgi:hypothetical protein